MRRRVGVVVLGMLVALLLVLGASAAFGGSNADPSVIPFVIAPVNGPERPSDPGTAEPLVLENGSANSDSGNSLLGWVWANRKGLTAVGFGLLLSYVLADSMGVLGRKNARLASLGQRIGELRNLNWWEEAKAAVKGTTLSIIEGLPGWWQTTKDFGRGFLYEVSNSVGWGIPNWVVTGPLNRSVDDSPGFCWGRAVGGLASIVGGLAEIIGGIGGTAGGVAGIVFSGGTATLAAAPVVVASWGLVIHGSGVLVASVAHTGPRIGAAIASSAEPKPLPEPLPEAIDPEVPQVEPFWKKFQKLVTGRKDVAEYKGSVYVNGKWRKIRLDDLRQGPNGEWAVVDAKGINFGKPWYSTSWGQSRTWRKWLEQLQAQQVWARNNGVKEIRWVLSEKPPLWLRNLLNQAIRQKKTLGSDINIIFTTMDGGV